jgi:hypothetical protein
MLATVSIETGYENPDQQVMELKPVTVNGPSSGFQTYLGLIDVRRVTSVLEVVKRCRLTCGLDISRVLSDVHFKMLSGENHKYVISHSGLKNGSTYYIKCRKYHDRKTGVKHTLTIVIHGVSVPRLDNEL